MSGGRAEAQRSRPERPALSKSAVGPARDCGPPGSGAPLEPQLTGCCAGVRSTAGVGLQARSSPLPSGPPSVRPFVRQHGPAPAKASAPSPPTCSKSCPHLRPGALLDVRDHALLLLPLLLAGGAALSGCGHDGAVVLVGSPGVSR